MQSLATYYGTLPTDVFTHSGNIVVPKAEIIDQSFAEDSAVAMVGPFSDGDKGMEVIATRMMMYLPPQYASIALANPVMTPKRLGKRLENSSKRAKELTNAALLFSHYFPGL